MNKRKKVAIQKHRAKAKKVREKLKGQRPAVAAKRA